MIRKKCQKVGQPPVFLTPPLRPLTRLTPVMKILLSVPAECASQILIFYSAIFFGRIFNCLTGQSPEEITNLLCCIYYNYPFFTLNYFNSFGDHRTLVPIATVSFFQSFQEVGSVGFLSRQSKMRASTIIFLPQDRHSSLMSNENYV